jgi:hypothetical protein
VLPSGWKERTGLSNPTRSTGSVLAGRYRLEDRYHANTDSSVWRAADLTLDRAVTVRVMRPGHPYSADVADAARRVALIEDPRLVRVLDVGTDGDITFVVTTHVDGDSVATLIERAPLDPMVVRRIVGEVAQGLRGAAARGLHHLRLTPRSVIITYDNTIKISGVAVEAAAAGLDPATTADANRVDALGLIGLLYAGLTGRWPLGDPGFAPAPRTQTGGPIAPAELVPDIPGELNRLCMLTLGPLDSGPHSPAEVVGMLSPWPSAEEAPLRSASRPRDPATPATPNPALVMRGRSQLGHTPAGGVRPVSQSANPVNPIGTAASDGLPRRPFPADPSMDPDRTVAAWSPSAAAGSFDFRGGQAQRDPDPDVTLPPSAAPRLGPALGGEAARLAAPPSTGRTAPRPSAWPSSPDRAVSARPQRPQGPEVTRPAPAEPPQGRPPRRTASLFPTPSVAMTGSMALPPRVRTNERTDALFSEPESEASLPALPAAPAPEPPPAPQHQPQSRPDHRPSSRKPALPLEPAPSPRLQPTPTPRESQPPLGAPPPTRQQRPQSNPAARTRPAPAAPPRPAEGSGGSDGRPVRRTASIFPTPSVAMTGSMPLPPRTRSRGRTEALFGDVEPAIDTQMTPMPVQAVQEAARRAAQEASQQALEKARQSRQPAQFAQPPSTRGAANPLDSGPIPTAAAARTAAGLRAGRPASRPIEDARARPVAAGAQSSQGGWSTPKQNADPLAPGSAPSLFAPMRTSFAPAANATGNPAGNSFGEVPGGDAPGAGLAPADEAGQHAGMGSERAAGPGRHRGAAGGREPGATNARLPWHEGWPNNPQSLQPPSPMESSGPFPIVIPPDAPPKGQSRKVLFGIFLVFLVLLLVAAWSLRGLVSGSGDGDPVSQRERGPVITTAPVAAGTSVPGETAAAGLAPAPTKKAVAVEIRTATAIDPQGDGEENSGDAPLAVDGEKGTAWGSKTYTTANFGQLKKGLGLAIELRRSAAVSSAKINVAGTGGRVQVRTADRPEYEGSSSVGSGSFEDGKVTVDAKGDVDAAKYVIVWFTELPSVEGKYRLEVSEVRLT